MIEVMISQPMNGKTDGEIQAVREDLTIKIQHYLKEKYPEEWSFNIIDSVIKNHESKYTLECFAESIMFLSQADYLVMANGWRESRGCRLEHEIASEYGVSLLYEETL